MGAPASRSHVKALGDQIKLIHPGGNSVHRIEHMGRLDEHGKLAATDIDPVAGTACSRPCRRRGAFIARLLGASGQTRGDAALEHS